MIKVSTSKGRELYERSQRDYGSTLDMIYGRYSQEKAKAMKHCKELFCKDMYANHFRIISYNTFGFSVAWNTSYEIEYGVVVRGVHIETPSNSYDVIFI